MGSNRPPPPPPVTKDFFAAPALTLSLAGAFGRDAAAGGEEVEEGDEGDGCGIGSGGGGRLGEEVDGVSSENTGVGSQSGDGSGEFEEGRGGNTRKRRRKTKNYHRHAAEQVSVMEAVFKESPHPDETQRQQLGKQLGLSSRQVKFWFQNRRTQIKAIQERQENSLLKSELENLHRENRAMRELARRPSPCPNCGVVAAGSSTSEDDAAATREQHLRLENAKLKAEVRRLRDTLGEAAAGGAASPTSPPFSAVASTIQKNNRISQLDDNYVGGFLCGHVDKQSIMDRTGRALDELTTMTSSGEPLWMRSVETGRDILNYDEYVRVFRRDGNPGDQQSRWSVEASRESGVVYLDTIQLVNAFMDANQWKELFPSMISKASTVDVIATGDDKDARDGVVQLMFAEVQMLTPMVPTREFYFARYCKKLAAEKWAIVDVSLEKVEAGGDPSSSSQLFRCRKNPSGCIIEEQTNSHSMVTWVEHTECREQTASSSATYRTATASGVAFGARRWVAALQQQCERMVFSVATNVPTRDSVGVSTPAGRRSVLKLAHRMTSRLYRCIAGSRGPAWSRASSAAATAGDIRLTSRKNVGDPGEPQGLIACAVLSAWLPVSPAALLDFLRDESRRPEWDVMLPRKSVQSRRLNLTKGKVHGNCVTAYAPATAEEQRGGNKWIIQDSCTSPCESTVVYGAVSAAVLEPVIGGRDSTGVAVLPCGLAVMPDGAEWSRPTVITSSKEGMMKTTGGGSLVTIAFQVLASSSPEATLSPDSVEMVTSMVSRTLRNIEKGVECDDR